MRDSLSPFDCKIREAKKACLPYTLLYTQKLIKYIKVKKKKAMNVILTLSFELQISAGCEKRHSVLPLFGVKFSKKDLILFFSISCDFLVME